MHLSCQSESMKAFEYLYEMYFKANTSDLDVIETVSKELNNYSMTPLHSACKVRKLHFLVI